MVDTIIVLSTHRGLPMQENAVTASTGTAYPSANPTNAIDGAGDSIILVVDTTLENSRAQVIQGLERIMKAIVDDPIGNKYFTK